jgi:hypothetical protein
VIDVSTNKNPGFYAGRFFDSGPGACSQAAVPIQTITILPEAAPTATAVATAAVTIPIEVAAVEEAPPNECLVCHTEKQWLIDTADPEEETPSESLGWVEGGRWLRWSHGKKC